MHRPLSGERFQSRPTWDRSIRHFGDLLGELLRSWWLLHKVIDAFLDLRVTDEEKEDCLDFAEPSGNSYPDFETAEN